MNIKNKLALGVLALALVCGANSMAAGKAKGSITGVVNINQADVAQLTMLPGVGPAKAQAIRQYAQAHPFKTVDEIKEVKGIGEKQFAKLKSHLSVAGASTVQWVQSNPQAAGTATLPAAK